MCVQSSTHVSYVYTYMHLTRQGNSSTIAFHWKVTCSRLDVAEKLPRRTPYIETLMNGINSCMATVICHCHFFLSSKVFIIGVYDITFSD